METEGSAKEANQPKDHEASCMPLTIIWGSDSLGVLLPHIIRRGRGPGTIIDAFFGCPPVGTRSASPFISRRPTSSPSVPVIAMIPVSIPVPLSVIRAFLLSFATATRTAGPITRPICGRWRSPIPVVAPNRRRWIFSPLE